MLTDLRAIAVICFLLVSRLKNVSFSKLHDETSDQQALQSELPQESKPTLVITPELLDELRAFLLQTTASDVSEEEKNKVLEAYIQGIPRREICAYLRWGAAKYATIVKPVLDAYEEQERQMGNIEKQA